MNVGLPCTAAFNVNILQAVLEGCFCTDRSSYSVLVIMPSKDFLCSIVTRNIKPRTKPTSNTLTFAGCQILYFISQAEKLLKKLSPL